MRVIREIWNDWTRFHLQRSKERGTEKERIYRDSNSTTLVERNDATFDSRFISVRIMRLRPVENPNVQRIYMFPFRFFSQHLATLPSPHRRVLSVSDLLILRHVPSVREKEREGKREKESYRASKVISSLALAFRSLRLVERIGGQWGAAINLNSSSSRIFFPRFNTASISSRTKRTKSSEGTSYR